MKCRFCGNEIEDGSLFCGYCGKEQPKVKYCIQCGHEIDADAEFCGYCGAKQSGNEASTSIVDARNDYANTINDSRQEPLNIDLQSSCDVELEDAPKQTEIPNNDNNSYTDEDDTNSSKKWYIIGAIALIAFLGIYFGV
jgi:RNA polymerase subunit RPABC4/transcription elongation factor Spt4